MKNPSKIFLFRYVLLILWAMPVKPRRDYKLTVERGEIFYLNKDLVSGYGTLGAFNRTCKSINMSLTFKNSTPELVEVNMKQFLSNEYRQGAIYFKKTLSEALNWTSFDIQNLVGHTQPPFRYPLRPNVSLNIRNSYGTLIPIIIPIKY